MRTVGLAGNGLLVGVFVFLCAIAIELSVWNVFLYMKKDPGTNKANDAFAGIIEESEEAMPYVEIGDTTIADTLASEIDGKYESGEYTLKAALREYDNAFNNSEGEVKVYFAMRYADFVMQNADDYSKAVTVMKSIEGIVDENNARYYAQLARIYDAVGETVARDECLKRVAAIESTDNGTGGGAK